MKRIAILGSSGSIGTQALEVISANPDKFKAEVLTVNGNADVLISQALTFKPKTVVITDESNYQYVKKALADTGIEVLAGEAALAEVVTYDSVDMVLTAVVGYVGLKPTIAAIKAGKDIALANKETLVVAGDLVTRLAREYKVNILPVDSEHSAIFQCLAGEENNPIEKIILTASGGPFRGKGLDDLRNVTKNQALKHPNWSMGAKITIDSASLMNKGLEVIEAKWLFDLDLDQIEVVVHPQSIVHSLVQFNDGSIKAQLGLPDMKLPIQYAMAYPQRIKNDFPRFSFANYSNLTFEAPDTKTFRNLALAFEALSIGGNCPCVINAANEVVVDAFLKDKIGFLQMSDIIAECMQKVTRVLKPVYEDYVETDKMARITALELIGN
ncbi:1-deoxy-D-xylulose-5-phosphate reductoisomerase [Solitalea canadensis]|uniref:1-deoxy-D-xylulose 5-phosphate reductoisomerase n=1 Tax=Solitalea canadensis (strain ATCC 29591 / DSM 3403 / JCM 21819 / LMG 8368 / NBRC 15130 / NCIMB 12057 / USAM 9D) TaxID=929556 RepID=H8KV55_SOLCM|nr:1-deoxy-D-xylulose-5-phosphate reductoisomerase [Solitalea canadensis]AFD06055.1 1-deoxy-D-xylulose 5-phosphate reductoisomerase [Solitalea canadensis DSM 3403]